MNTTTLLEVFQYGSQIAGVFDLEAAVWPQPGQYLACQHLSDELDIHPANLFHVLGDPGQLTLGPIPAAWQPGDKLVCTPPQGQGFHLPEFARRVGLIPFETSAATLLSLVNAAFAQRAAVALFLDAPLTGDILQRMPSGVEVLPLAALQENPGWPDYLAVDLPLSAFDRFADQVVSDQMNYEGELLVRTAMPCRGIGACGVCAVHTRRGWRYACLDGPVFPLRKVFNVAR